MLRDVDDHGFPPAEEEIAEPCPQEDGETEPGVVGHEDEHEEVGEEELQHVQQGLHEVRLTPHAHAGHGGQKK